MRLTALLLAALAGLGAATAQDDLWANPKSTPSPSSQGGPFVRLRDGSLLALDGNATFVSTDEGKTWSAPRPIYTGAGPGIPATGPLVRTPKGVLILVYMDQVDAKFKFDLDADTLEADLDVWAIRSLDEGKTWVDRQKILDGYCGALLNMIVTRSGHVVVPVMDALRGPIRHGQYTYVSADDGKTWTRSNLLDVGGRGDHDGGIEATVTELTDGTLWMLLRTNLDRFWSAYSDDHGYHWRRLEPSNIEASTSPGLLLRLASGRLLLAWNRLYPAGLDEAARKQYPRRHAPWQSERDPSWHRDELSVACSSDDGKTWTEPVVVLRKKNGNLAYPYVFEVQPGQLWLYVDGVRRAFREADFLAP
jgi:sialidase-1